MTSRWWVVPPPSRNQKIALVACVLVGVAASLVWLALGRPALPAKRWGLAAECTVNVVAALAAPRGARWYRLCVWARCALAANAAVLVTVSAAAEARGEDRTGRLVVGGTCLLLGLLPVVTGRRARVRRLSGLDALFLAIDTPRQPINVTALLLLRPGAGLAGSPGPLDLDGFRRHVAGRLGGLPAFRSRVVPIPFGLGRPVYVEDAEFDIAEHVVEHVLAAPGTNADLDAFCTGLTVYRFDRGRPLWRLILVRGLADGRQGIVLLAQHAIMDGYALRNTLLALLGEPSGDAVPASRRPPARVLLLGGALARGAWSACRLPGLVRASRAHAAAVQAELAASPAPAHSRDTPDCPLSPEATGRRTFARTGLAVDDLQLVKHAACVTLNDVILALVAGAVRDYLARRASLPAAPLLAWVPVGEKAGGTSPRTFGNRLQYLTASLATDHPDPWDRLIAIGASTARAKQVLAVGNPDLAAKWLDHLPPVLVERYVARKGRSSGPAANCVVSHVRFEPFADLDALYVAGPPTDIGVNVTLASHGADVFVAVVCIDAAVPDPGELTEGMHRALAELLARVPASADSRELVELR